MKIQGLLHLNPLGNYFTKKPNFYAFCGTDISSKLHNNWNIPPSYLLSSDKWVTSSSHLGSVEVDQEWEERCCRGSHDPFFAVYGATGLLEDPKDIHQNYLETSNKCFNRCRFRICNQNLTIIAPYASHCCLDLVGPYGHTKNVEVIVWSHCHNWS